jgi:hypothetical protein
MLQTEFSFTLPCGYVDVRGNLHRQGTMRLATALDEIEPLQDARVRANEAYLTILVLSRVVTRLGDLYPVDVSVIEGLFSADLAYLQRLYVQINEVGTTLFETQCPRCGLRFALNLAEGGKPDDESTSL